MEPHWYDKLPPLLLVVIALALMVIRIASDAPHSEALLGIAGVFAGAAIVLEAIRGR